MDNDDPVIARLRALKPRFLEMNLKRVCVFGSRRRGTGRPGSDLDLLVEFARPVGFFGFLETEYALEEALGCKIDMVTPAALHPALKESILAEASEV